MFLNIWNMSWWKTVKLSWVYGNQLPPDLPSDLPAYEILEMSKNWPFSISNTDEVSVVLLPDGDAAKLVAYQKDESESSGIKMVAEKTVKLDELLLSLQETASAMARRATGMLSRLEWPVP